MSSLVGLLVAGLGWLGALRDGIRAVFGVEGEPGNVVTAKLRDLGVMVLLGAGVVVSAAVGAVAGGAATWLSEHVGLGRHGWPLTIVSLLVGVLLDGVLVALMLRVLTGVPIPWPALRGAALFGGLALTALKKFGTLLLSATTGNPLFASFAAVVGLLVWLNLMSRVLLVSAAWAANDLDAVSGVEGPESRGAAQAARGPGVRPAHGPAADRRRTAHLRAAGHRPGRPGRRGGARRDGCDRRRRRAARHTGPVRPHRPLGPPSTPPRGGRWSVAAARPGDGAQGQQRHQEHRG